MTVPAMDRPPLRARKTRTAPYRLVAAVRAALLGVAVCSSAWAAADDTKIIFPSGTPGATAPAAHASTAGANTFTLIVAVLLAGVGGWMVWRNRRGPALARGVQLLAVEETRTLGNRQYLVVASYEGQKFLLGVCPGRIDLLAPLAKSKTGELDR